MNQPAPADATVTGFANTVTTPIVNLLGAHPVGFLVGLLVVVVALGLTNGIRFAYPVHREPTDQPRWAAFLLGFFDPFVGNFWLLISWGGARFGFKVRSPYDASSAPEEKAE